MVGLANKYQKLDHREHILKRPNMYIGSIEYDTYTTWVYDEKENSMTKRELHFVPGFYKIFDEILVNAIDHSVRLKMQKDVSNVNIMKNIKVSIEKDSGYIEVYNDGDGIDIELHPEHSIYIPELIFGHLLTSANYDDKEERVIGGQNGIGSKACNVFSKHFTVETVDAKRKKLYKQEFSDNMSNKTVPEIKSCSKKPYTIIRFLPDYEKFGMKGLSNEMYQLLVKRTYDTCAVTDNDINVFLNGNKLEYKNFEKYVDLYLGNKNENVRIFERIDDRWEIVAGMSDSNTFEQVSFVNGIWTIRGGKHVDYISNQIVKKLVEMATKKKKDIAIKPQYLKDNLFIFVKSTIVNPSFDSQTKETLTTPYSKFGSKPEISDKFVEKMFKSGIIEKAVNIGNFMENKNMKKTDGKKKSVIRGLAKLDDANWAGTNKSNLCTLILTEGDSARTMVMSGIDEVGRDKYGVFPLKGKLLNVKDCPLKKIIDNEEITNLKKIIGLESDKDYKNVDDLRYGRIMILTDQDVDGSHIKGLLFNLFQSLWPSLFKHDGFLTSMLTPIVKARKGNQTISFFSLVDYENWKKEHGHESGWELKYYKGLGTSDGDEAREYFRALRMLKYEYEPEISESSIELAFNKKRSDDRKEWLMQYNRQDILDFKDANIPFREFINKELIHFSNYDVLRSIPSMCDGLKPSQRKIMYCCFKKSWTKECKVAQLSAHVSENSAYHHGEESLNNTIICLAQNFVGSNNINLLKPNGQFGTRIKGGKDSSSPRYIYTEINPITHKIFRKEDFPILTYLDDDGMTIEPEYYVPIIPLVLVNGAIGIGTGFSTNIPCYNPQDIVSCLKKLILRQDDDLPTLIPWYLGFTGSMTDTNGKYFTRGTFEKLSPTKIKIKELPIGFWTEDFKELLEQMIDSKPYLKNYESHYNDIKVDFVLHFQNAASLDDLLTTDDNGFLKLENEFKLVSSKTLSTTNMYLFNEKRQITKYSDVTTIMKDFYNLRIKYYQKRKDYQIAKLEQDRIIMKAKIDFINEVIAGTLKIYNETKVNIEDQLVSKNYPKKDNSFDYLVGMPIYNLTAEKKLKLEVTLSEMEIELESTINRTCAQMWMLDLEDFESTYKQFTSDYESSLARKNKTKKK